MSPEKPDRKAPDSKTRHIFAFADTLPQVVFEMDLLGNLVFVNQAGIELFGFTTEEFEAGMNAFQLLAPEDRQRAQENAVEVVGGRGRQGNEYTALHKDGSRFPIIIYSNPVNKEGNPAGLRGVIVDISRRKRSENLLKSLNAVSLSILDYNTREEIFETLARELGEHGFTTVVMTADEQENVLRPDYLSFESKLLKKAEKLLGLSKDTFSFAISDVDVFRRVCENRITLLEEDHTELFRQLLPRGTKTLLKPLIRLLNVSKAIIAPLAAQDRLLGLLSVQSETLSEDDIPAITAFANQIAAQWHKAELLETMETEVEDRREAEARLRSSEEKFRILFESAPDAMFLTDLKGVFLDGNKASEELVGYGRDKLIGKSFFELKLLSPSDILKAGKMLALNVAGKKTEGAQYTVNKKTGEKIPVEISAFPVELHGKKTVLGIARDISARIESDKLLRESEERFRRMAESLEDGLTIIEKGKRVYVNSRLCDITGYPNDELMDMTWESLAEQDDRERIRDAYSEIETGRNIPEKLEFWICCRDGRRRCVLNTCSVKEWEKGAVDLYIITTDITDRKLAEKALFESEEQYKRLVENAKEAIFILQDGLIQYCNPNSAEISGYTYEELKSIPFTDFIFPHDRDMVISTHMARLRGEEVEDEYSFRIIRKDNSVRWVEIRAVLIEWETRTATLIFMTDITERKHAEDLLRAQRDLALAIGTGRDYEEILLGCLKGLISLPGLDAGGIYLENRETGMYELVCHAGLSISFIEENRQFPHDSKNAERILNGDPVYSSYDSIRISNFGREMEGADLDEDLKALGVIPIRHDGRAIGCINVASHQMPEISPEVRNTLESVIPHLGVIIGKAKAEKALRESEVKFRNIVQSSPMGIHLYELRPSGRLVLSGANPAADSILGVDNTYFFGKSVEEVFPGLADSNILEKYKTTASEGTPWFSEQVEYHSDTIKGAIEVNAFQTGPNRMAAMFLDITQRKKGEEALKESEQRFRSLIEKSPVGFSIIQDCRVIYRNGAQESLNDPLPGMIEKQDFSMIHPEDADLVRKFCSDICSDSVPEEGIEFRFYISSETDAENLVWVSCGAGEFDFKGRPAILMSMMDVTRTKRLEHVVRIQEKLTSLGRVAAGIAHEIRNPLSGINIYLDTLRTICTDGQEINTEKGIHILNQIEKASGKIESVIKRVMDFSKPGTAKLTKGDINKPVKEAVQLSAVTIRKMNIKLTEEYEVKIPECRFDHSLIEEVILNLIHNAAQAMEKSPEKNIRVSTGEGDNAVFIRVSDSGPGIPPDKREQLFEPFFTTKNDSTGIGLSICRRIIADHRGTLEVSEGDMGGAEFTVELPLRRVGT